MTEAPKPTLLIVNIGTAITFNPEKGEGPLGEIRDAVIAMRDDKILWVGPRRKLRAQKFEAEEIDAQGALVTPGLVDCHTHAIFSGSRADEFFARLSGESYEEIARKGGGIHRTSEATHEAEDGRLLEETRRRLDRFLRFGVTTVEVKSGYGFSALGELRLLCLIHEIRHAVDTIPTFLGAHVVPREFARHRDDYVRLVCEEMIPQVVRQKLSDICDVFCDRAAFTVEETRRIFEAARAHDMKIKIHADQLSDTGGAELAAEFGAISADHLEHVNPKGIRALAKSGTVAVLLPGAVFAMGKGGYPPARKLIEAGVSVAISTDCNPGTSFSENLPLMMTFAARELRMTIDEIWKGVTLHAARALGLSDRGAIRGGARADLVIWDAERPEEIPYHYGASFAQQIVQRGRLLPALDTRDLSY
jgi:imidazolonepropionase